MEDEKIIALFFARSEQGIRELDTKYGTLCRRLSFRILGNQPDAEECVNDAYLGTWNAIPPATPELLPAFVLKIVRNISLCRYRAKTAAKRSSMQEVAMEELEFIACEDTVENTVEAKELARMLEAFLDTLNQKNRAIFLRRYWFYESCAEIAAKVGLSEKNITVRLTRIRAQLKKYLLEREVSL
ncbi:MAG: sigma-70 family RNA polymerase sigma factor [Lachnospiraceae bacterium]|nr:sigma-70 family RNA polymerase sigma factor [Lachnospiraceae bacterium]